jgi:hypothetical protein
MSEERIVEAVNEAPAAAGIEDTVTAAGEFNPRGHSGAGFAGNRAHPQTLVFRVPRAGLEVRVHQRVNVRVLELIDTMSGSRIELEGMRLPITHTKDVIQELT